MVTAHFGQAAYVRVIGGLLVVIAAILGLIGAGWAALAIVGREWDYCPGGNECIAGELVGLVIVAIAAIAAWSGIRLSRSR